MRAIDGARGEGGGQVLRTALALSLLTGEPLKIVNIRAGRKRPGLLRQHLCSVKLAAEVGRAAVEGAEPGSRELVFRPRGVQPGHYEIAIGTAGSTTLVLQTVLPALLTAEGPTTLVLEGGTHNPFAPPYDFLQRTFVPIINRLGPLVAVQLDRPGFYPAGGGRMLISIQPAGKLGPLELLERGEVRSQSATATIAALSPGIAMRELSVLGSMLGWSKEQLRVNELDAALGPGNVLSAVIESEHVTEVFTGFGEKAVRAEVVAESVAMAVRAYLDAGAPVGPHLADQLLLPLALAKGGAFRTMKFTEHTRTQLELIRELTGTTFHVDEGSGGGDRCCRVIEERPPAS